MLHLVCLRFALDRVQTSDRTQATTFLLGFGLVCTHTWSLMHGLPVTCVRNGFGSLDGCRVGDKVDGATKKPAVRAEPRALAHLRRSRPTCRRVTCRWEKGRETDHHSRMRCQGLAFLTTECPSRSLDGASCCAVLPVSIHHDSRRYLIDSASGVNTDSPCLQQSTCHVLKLCCY
ncbi:hypothetical protein, variant [Verruconis gallopava]|uniref:Uncharacterized protein n=1 Tax=Verruconis gallopava TaxID=253628 RepID=A0A0D1YXA8_9PEZI|nr:uncharacterized protein PV09_03860 [Verruconis gallopava]XP_016215211.1 hypothetical protein, variant [Verruconis gallopava]KIW05341.1 hypothetical protein PV09_03860 [Verruconis gallopava]KIW05342.1 hypothetical protein, variant [Verruconis gallopava]